jgi:hypothetical protein
VSEVSAFVERAWREGVGPDERAALLAVLAIPEAVLDPELRLFSAWFDLLVELAVEIPPAPPTPAGVVLHAAAQLAVARIVRDAAGMQAAIGGLATALAALPDSAPNAAAANAWADLALGDVAAVTSDPAAMRRRFESVAAESSPVALRITAMFRLVGTAMSRVDPGPARKWARRALTLAESHDRPAHAARARILLGMIDYVNGDVTSMRKTMTPLLVDPENGLLARLLLASAEPASAAMPLFAEGIRQATEKGDLAGYMLCILIGSRRYVAIGRRADALVTISAGIVELRKLAAPLAKVLEDERMQWREAWGPAGWAAAEAEALAGL